MPRISRSREAAQVAAHNANVRTLESTALLWIVENQGKALAAANSATSLTPFMKEWPTLPAALTATGKPLAGKTAYTVDITADGGITVDPAKID